MAINPLLVFVGLSAAAVGGIVYVNQVKTPLVDTAPVVQNKRTIPLPEPVVKSAKKVASLPPGQVASTPDVAPTKQPEPKAPKTPLKTPPPPMPDLSGPTSIVPSFDVVRIEKDGGAVVVGKAAPNVMVKLLLNGKPFGSTKSNGKGDWVFIPYNLIPAGNHQLIVQAKDGKNGKNVQSAQTIVIALAKNKQAKPLVVVASNDAPTKVLQKPTAKAAPVPPVKKTEVAKQRVTQKLQKRGATPNTKKVETQSKAAANTPVQSAPAASPAPAATEKKPKTKKTAALAPVPAPKPDVAVTPPPTLAPEAKKKPAARKPVAVKKPLPKKQTLAFGTIDYNDSGNMVFSGTATPNKKIRLYVDNTFVGDAVSDAQGKWVFSGRRDIKPGVHQLRADLISSVGAVARRAAVPFMRANPVKVAALLKTRVQSKSPAAKKPEVAKSPTQKGVAEPEKPAELSQNPASLGAQKPKKVTQNKKSVAPVTENPRKAEKKKPAAVDTTKTVSAPLKDPAPVVVDAEKIPMTEQANGKKPTKEIATKQQVPASPPPALKIARAPDVAQPDDQKTDTNLKKKVSHVVIQPGNNLWNISRVIYGKGIAYTTIFQANKEQIKDPDKIYPGQIFDTPGVTSSGAISPDLREPETSTVQ